MPLCVFQFWWFLCLVFLYIHSCCFYVVLCKLRFSKYRRDVEGCGMNDGISASFENIDSTLKKVGRLSNLEKSCH
jgi:hypothetical protein